MPQQLYNHIVNEGKQLKNEVDGLLALKEKLTSLKESLEMIEKELKQFEVKKEQILLLIKQSKLFL